MKSSAIFGVIALLCVFPAAAFASTTMGTVSSGTVIDFGTITNGEVVTNQIPGITFSNWWGSTAYHLDFFSDLDGVQIANFTPTDSVGEGNATITFSAPVSSVGFELLTNNSAMTFDVISGSGTDTFL